MNRREFFSTAGTIAAAGAVSSLPFACSDARSCHARAKNAYKTTLLVVGGGPSGVCAAVSAARLGIETMLIDNGNCLGGMGTKGLVGPFMTCYDASGTEMIIRGLFEEVVERLIAKGGAIHPSKIHQGTEFTAWISEGHEHCTPFDAELLKVVYDEMCAEAGVKVPAHCDQPKRYG